MWTIIVLGIFYINYPFVALWLAPTYGKQLGPVIMTLIGGAVVVVGLVYVSSRMVPTLTAMPSSTCMPSPLFIT